MRVWLGWSYPLGATWDGLGVNFALFSEHATKVELCLFDSADATKESHRITMPEQTDQVWHAYLPDVRPGQLYGYRVHGPYEAAHGHRFNANKVLLDPYAQAIGRDLRWDDALYGYKIGNPGEDLTFDERDSAPFAPLGMVIDTAFTWGNDRPPATPSHRSIVYELHVKGFTKRHPGVPEPLRGTYAGLGSPAAIDHLLDLGVTAVELLPVHYHVEDRFLIQKKLVNYWGYNTLGFFAPDPRFAATKHAFLVLREFKQMVRTLHAAGIEVILDVVYNHTAEGNQCGPTLSMRGIDNASYYRLAPDPRYYMDFTGCGNTPNMQHPRMLQLIMDSLRHWVADMHVDGFRFDLAATLARELHDVDKLGAFFDIIHQDPVLSQVKLIAEPWDVGPGGYQVGNFPVRWSEWNGKYRDCVRRFWKGDGGTVAEFASRLTGSATCTPGAAARRTPASTSSPATTASTSRISSLTTRSTTRPTARRTATARTTMTRGTAAPRGHRGPEHPGAAGPAETQFHGHAAPLARRAHDPVRRRVQPHATGQQQRVLPGQRADLVGFGSSPSGWSFSTSCARLSGSARRTRPFNGAVFSRAGPCAATRSRTFTGSNPAARR